MIARTSYFPPLDRELRKLFTSEELELVGVADVVPATDEQQRYSEWLSHGYAGSMEYLKRHAPLKFDPAKILPGACSILFAAINYYRRPERNATTTEGRIARYAWGRDYHRVIGGRLRRIARILTDRFPDNRFKPYADATPLAERFYAERAGIGFTGRNTLLISSQYGSWFLLGEILSTKRFDPSGPAGHYHGDCPGSCRRCLDVCPTGALLAPGKIDASRCISYLTIEHKGSIPEELRPKLGNWLFGCDLCQEVCPLNLRERETGVSDFLRAQAGETRGLETILSIRSDEEFRRSYAGSPLMRAKRRGLKRNACVVAANNGAVSLLPQLIALGEDLDPIVAEHAVWAVKCLERLESSHQEKVSERNGKPSSGFQRRR